MQELEKYLFGAYVFGVKYGVCIPSSCSQEDFTKMIDFGAEKLNMNIEVDLCEVPEPFTITYSQKVILTIFAVIICVCLVATVVSEVYLYKSQEGVQKKTYSQHVLESFSVVTNFRKLMQTKPAEMNSFDCMNGIRFLSMTWVVLGHSYNMINKNQVREPFYLLESRKDSSFCVIAGAFMSLETFFLITAILLSYNLVTLFDKSGTYNPIIVFVRRLWRFYPIVAVGIGFQFLVPLMGSGSDFKGIVGDQVDMCVQNWWKNILFINNFIDINKQCLTPFWYLAVDMQCLVLAIIYFFLLFKKPMYGMTYLSVLLIGCVVSSAVVTYLKEFPPAPIIAISDIESLVNYANYVYIKPPVHLGSYSVGLFLGTFLARNKKVTLSKCYALLGWLAATCIGITVVYAVHPWNSDVEYTMVEAIMFSACQRTVWGICVAWVVFACYVGKGGYVNELLSWPGFQPLVKLTFLVYVVHFPIMTIYALTRLGNEDLTHSQRVYIFLGTLVLSHIVAVFLRLLFESPAIEVERVFFSWFTTPKDKKSEKAQEDAVGEEKFTESERYSFNEALSTSKSGTDNHGLKIDL